MLVSAHLRGGGNLTDIRTTSISAGISHMCDVRLRGRGDTPEPRTELVIQTGFNSTPALKWALDNRIPYIIMEGPLFRDMCTSQDNSTFTFNGMQAGGTRPTKIPEEPRPHPEILLCKAHGSTIILGQKPNDHSLRGHDHTQWIKEMMDEYPDAELRHNPIVVPPGSQPPIAEALLGCYRTISYTSTAAVDSVFAGCKTICKHPASEAYDHGNREEWAHRLSWYNFTHEELQTHDIASFIMSGYSQAWEDAREGRQETPRAKVEKDPMIARYIAEFS